jgi:hypothetical protein
MTIYEAVGLALISIPLGLLGIYLAARMIFLAWQNTFNKRR